MNIKKQIPLIITTLILLWMVSSFFKKPFKSEFDIKSFSELPVLLNGRIKPIDTVARTSLLVLYNKQNLRLEDRKKLSAIEWLLELMTKPEIADERKVFVIHNSEVLGLFNWTKDKEKYFSYKQIEPHFNEVERQASLANEIETQARTLFQREIFKLYQNLTLYFRLKNSLRIENSPNFLTEIENFSTDIHNGMVALRKKNANEKFNEQDYLNLMNYANRFLTLQKTALFKPIPPEIDENKNNEKTIDDWLNIGDSILDSFNTGNLNPLVLSYAKLLEAYRNNDPESFNQNLELLKGQIGNITEGKISKAKYETVFNQFSPFYKCMTLYVIIFIVAIVSWLKWPELLGRTAFHILVLAAIFHTGGLIFRMLLEGRPPVTNLYSSAIFIGWGAVILGVVLEKFYRNGIGSATAAIIGFMTLLIAHHLSMSGDTLEMMRAVLDSNFWLATHVVVITLGYASTFLAGFLAVVYILRGVLTPSLTKETALSLSKMVYGIVCFATLFSLVGTILGGIWADQSWGRFWGWDPKENGALLIVIWNAIILHARWGGMIKQRGLMVLAIFGNIVTSWSWFGTNMLGIGLHSYGFMDSAFFWLLTFCGSQIFLMCIGGVPLKIWRSKM